MRVTSLMLPEHTPSARLSPASRARHQCQGCASFYKIPTRVPSIAAESDASPLLPDCFASAPSLDIAPATPLKSWLTEAAPVAAPLVGKTTSPAAVAAAAGGAAGIAG